MTLTKKIVDYALPIVYHVARHKKLILSGIIMAFSNLAANFKLVFITQISECLDGNVMTLHDIAIT